MWLCFVLFVLVCFQHGKLDKRRNEILFSPFTFHRSPAFPYCRIAVLPPSRLPKQVNTWLLLNRKQKKEEKKARNKKRGNLTVCQKHSRFIQSLKCAVEDFKTILQMDNLCVLVCKDTPKKKEHMENILQKMNWIQYSSLSHHHYLSLACLVVD